jgi:hypothetical protein
LQGVESSVEKCGERSQRRWYRGEREGGGEGGKQLVAEARCLALLSGAECVKVVLFSAAMERKSERDKGGKGERRGEDLLAVAANEAVSSKRCVVALDSSATVAEVGARAVAWRKRGESANFAK